VEVEINESLKAEIDKRKFRRAKLITQVKCEALGREDLAVTRDLSAGGMFLNEKNPFPSKSIVSLAFRLTPTAPLLTCSGEVVYSLKGVGMGVMFTDVPADVRQALEKFVDEAN
jgi:c-di-GMP-binding flagellar brake protein YcgR